MVEWLGSNKSKSVKSRGIGPSKFEALPAAKDKNGAGPRELAIRLRPSLKLYYMLNQE